MSNSESLTPNDLRNQEFERKVRGYDPVEVASILEEVAAQWERMLADNLHLSEKCSALEGQISKYADLEQTLRDTLVLARKAAEDEMETAKKEAQLVVERARLDADSIVREANARAEEYRRQMAHLRNTRDRLKADLEGLLHSYTTQIRKLDDVDTSRDEIPPVAEPRVHSQSIEEISAPELPDSATAPFPEEPTGVPESRPLGVDAEQERADTQDPFDAALNKIFGSEAEENTADKPDTKGGPSSGVES